MGQNIQRGGHRFVTHEGFAAPFMFDNVSTDVIAPALTNLTEGLDAPRGGLGSNRGATAFANIRYGSTRGGARVCCRAWTRRCSNGCSTKSAPRRGGNEIGVSAPGSTTIPTAATREGAAVRPTGPGACSRVTCGLPPELTQAPCR